MFDALPIGEPLVFAQIPALQFKWIGSGLLSFLWSISRGLRVHGGQPRLADSEFDLALQRLQLIALCLARIRQTRIDDRRMRAAEDAEHCVVVGLADGIELVIVAARASQREALEGLGDNIDLVVGKGHHLVQRINRGEAVLHHAKLRNAERGFVHSDFLVEAGLRQQIAGYGLANQLRIGNIGIERADEIVTITPCIGNGRIAFATIGLCVANPIHPMPRPRFAEMR